MSDQPTFNKYSSGGEEELSWMQKYKEAMQNMIEPGIHRIRWPVGENAIVHSNKLDILLKVVLSSVMAMFLHKTSVEIRGTTSPTTHVRACAISTTLSTPVRQTPVTLTR